MGDFDKWNGFLTDQVWIIRHKETRKLWQSTSVKVGWASPGAAKNAWANCQGRMEYAKFDDQDEFDLINVMENLNE